MFTDEEETVKNKKPQPKNLDIMSVEELNEYITALRDEIARTEAAIAKKQSSRSLADSFFKN